MTENFDDLFDEIPPPETPVAVATVRISESAESVITNGKPPSKHAYLYLDLETVPDYSRLAQFDIPALPPMATALLTPVQFCSQTLGEVKEWFENHSAPEKWLSEIEEHERNQKKPRVGLFEAIQKSRDAVAVRSKLLSVTPEYCRIVAAAWATGSGKVHSTVFDQHAEAAYLETLWREIANVRTIIGYNILNFDLPVILTRSALLGVTPSRRINLSPYRNTDVCDLMVARWPKGGAMGLKKLARALGIEIPADDCDGSQVEMLYNTDPEKLKAYVGSDVSVTREVHRLMSGYFWD